MTVEGAMAVGGSSTLTLHLIFQTLQRLLFLLHHPFFSSFKCRCRFYLSDFELWRHQ